MRGRDENFIA